MLGKRTVGVGEGEARVHTVWLTVAFFGAVLVMTVGGAYTLHAANRERVIADFEQYQLHASDEVSAVLKAKLSGAALVLRTLSAGLAHQPTCRLARQLLDQTTDCGDGQCFAAIAAYDREGRVVRASARAPQIDASEVTASLRRVPEPAVAAQIRTTIVPSDIPSLLLLLPMASRAEGTVPEDVELIAGQLDLDSFFVDLERAASGSAGRRPVLILDDEGTVLFLSHHPEMRFKNVRQDLSRCLPCHDSFDHVKRLMELKHGVLRYEKHGVPQLGAVATLEFEGRSIITQISAPLQSAVGSLAEELRDLGLLMLAAVLASGAGMRMSWRDGRRRIRAGLEAARRADLERSHQDLSALNRHLESVLNEWRLTVDMLDAAVLLLEPSGTIQRMNRVAADTLPGAPFAWLGQPSDRLAEVPPWDSALRLARDAIEQRAISTARVVDEASKRTWDVWCRGMEPAGGRGLVIIVLRDVTSVVALQESVRRSETVAALGSVVLGVAHEVRNPLFAISSLVEALSVRKGRDPASFLDALRHEVSRLQTLMVELLEYGRPVSSTLRFDCLSRVVDQAICSCRSLAEARQVKLLGRGRSAAQVLIDEQRLTRVFINLIQNAVQHAPEHTAVTIDVDVPTEEEASTIAVVVRDSGPGFAAEDLPHVFTPFFSRRAGGFGLGLAIAERIVAEHRGSLAVGNHPSGGAMVKVLLPLYHLGGAAASEGAQPC